MDEGGARPVLPVLCYWNEALLQGRFKARQAHRYVSFDVDQGGLNNIRLVLEYAAVIAAITGRSLVLPPVQPWYLLDTGPMSDGGDAGVTDFADIFDLAALRRGISVLTAEQFIAEAANHLSIPKDFRREGVFDTPTSDDQPYMLWKHWLAENAEIMEGWNPYATLICYPDIASLDIESLDPAYVDGRQPIEFTPRMNAAPVLHFPSDETHRSLGPVATMLASSDEGLPRLTRRLLKHHVRYRREIYEIAGELIGSPGPHRYNALHVRRNDFQYQEARADAAATLENAAAVLDDDLPLYIATDETDWTFRDALAADGQVIFWEDLMKRRPALKIPHKFIGPVEQLVCACGARFVGTDLSTFSSYIVRLRGYCRAPDMAAYYHTEKISRTKDEPATGDFPGRDYLRENPLFWLDC